MARMIAFPGRYAYQASQMALKVMAAGREAGYVPRGKGISNA